MILVLVEVVRSIKTVTVDRIPCDIKPKEKGVRNKFLTPFSFGLVIAFLHYPIQDS